MKRRYLYHCTNDDCGPTLPVRRMLPRQPSKNEPPVPRLCVCPSVAECFAARLFDEGRPVFVYKTQKLMRGVTPVGVWDQYITRERWLIPPATLVLVGCVPSAVASEAQAAVRLYHQHTRLKSTRRTRLMSLFDAARVLRVYAGWTVDERRVRLLCGIAKKYSLPVDLAADWLLDRASAGV